jgi:hypothetical protein
MPLFQPTIQNSTKNRRANCVPIDQAVAEVMPIAVVGIRATRSKLAAGRYGPPRNGKGFLLGNAGPGTEPAKSARRLFIKADKSRSFHPQNWQAVQMIRRDYTRRTRWDRDVDPAARSPRPIIFRSPPSNHLLRPFHPNRLRRDILNLNASSVSTPPLTRAIRLGFVFPISRKKHEPRAKESLMRLLAGQECISHD